MSTSTTVLFVTLSIVALSIVALLFRGRPLLVGTTLLAPWAWCLVSVGAVTVVELLATLAQGDASSSWIDPCRYVAAMGTFCPAMAVLGAKRPQDRGWQWVVATLWVVLAIPAAQAVVFNTGPQVAPFAAWWLFAAVLLLLELLNYLVFSRFRWAAGMFVVGQLMLLVPHIRGADLLDGRYTVTALVLWLAAACVVWQSGCGRPSRTDYARQWSTFCDWYGAFWAFRVMSLINQTATVAAWPVRLMPGGFVPWKSAETGAREAGQRSAELISAALPSAESPTAELSLPGDVETAIRTAMRTALRRFF